MTMETASSTQALTASNLRARLDPAAAGIWVLAFVLPLYLALKGGGYDGIVRGQVGIAVWWAVIVGAAVGVLPVARPTRAAWPMIGLLTAFTAWTLLSTTWSSSSERSVLEAARVATHLGVLVLAVTALRRDTARHAVNALATAIAVVGGLALLSRLHPSWFPEPATATFLPSVASRLSYPLNYWNGLGAFMAMGIPLLLCVASSARTFAARALAAAAIPLCFATLYLAYSRGALLALAFALAVLLIAWPRRMSLLASVVVAAAGSALLVLNIAHRHELADGTRLDIALRQGDQLLWITAFVIIGCGLLQIAVALVDRFVERPRLLRISLRRLTTASLAAVLLVVVLGIAAGGVGKASDEWQSFKRLDTSINGVQGNTAQRLTATSGNGRYQYWVSATDAASEHPVKGVGAGTFEYWWAQHATIGGFIRNAHSLWMETLAELGYTGLVLIVALFGLPLVAGAVRMRRLLKPDRAIAAAALAGFVAFCVSATFEWVWQIAVLPVAALLLGAVLVMPSRKRESGRKGSALVIRLPLVAVAAAMIVLIALPVAGLVSVRESQADAQRNNLPSALNRAATAQKVQPYAATPQLQQALLLESAGNLAAAAVAAQNATRAERENWRTWLVLSRIEAERGHAKASVAAYRQAKSLNPKSSLFSR
jgi:hypothetical protein